METDRLEANWYLRQAIARDHKEIFAYYDEYVKNNGNVDAQERWCNQLTWEVARHSIAEELVVYPIFEKRLNIQGRRIAEEDRSEHQAIKNRLYELENLKVGSQEHAALLKDVIDHLRTHAQSEEQHDLPILERAIGDKDSQEAAHSFSRAKKIVPTRSHPSAPNKPPFETLAGLLAAPIDKLRDAFSNFPSEGERDAAVGKN